MEKSKPPTYVGGSCEMRKQVKLRRFPSEAAARFLRGNRNAVSVPLGPSSGESRAKASSTSGQPITPAPKLSSALRAAAGFSLPVMCVPRAAVCPLWAR